MPPDTLPQGNDRLGLKGSNVVSLAVPPTLLWVRTISIPREARSKLEEIARLDLRKASPFGGDDLYWQLGSPVVKSGRLECEQFVAKRSDVANWLTEAEHYGLKVKEIVVDGVDLNKPLANFSSKIFPQRRQVLQLNAMLVLTALIFHLTLWALPIWRIDRSNILLSEEVANEVRELAKLRARIEVKRQYKAVEAALSEKARARPLLIDSIREVTVALNDSTWLESFVFSGDRILISGVTEGSAAQLVLDLTSRPGFSDPALSGPVSRSSTGSERFEISARLGGN